MRAGDERHWDTFVVLLPRQSHVNEKMINVLALAPINLFRQRRLTHTHRDCMPTLDPFPRPLVVAAEPISLNERSLFFPLSSCCEPVVHTFWLVLAEITEKKEITRLTTRHETRIQETAVPRLDRLDGLVQKGRKMQRE